MTPRVLLVDDAHSTSTLLESELRRHFALEIASSENLPAVANFELVVLSPEVERSLELCRALASADARPPVIMLRPSLELGDAIDAIRAGASDVVSRIEDPAELVQAAKSLLEARKLEQRLSELARDTHGPSSFPMLFGASDVMQKLRQRLTRVASSDTSVLITGESGTGKDLVARALHEASARRSGQFVPISCSAIPRQLIESELFGHVKGAFTDAAADRAGLLLQASGGSLFLDEVADLPLEVQPKLLRVLQERRVRPLGQRQEVAFDARVIAATRRDLAREVEAGRFREDLYFRLNVIHVKLPPLREREHDALLLAQHFIQKNSSPERVLLGMTRAAARALLQHRWPGNVRELEHCIASAVSNARYDHLTEADLALAGGRALEHTEASERALLPLDEVEKLHILQVLRAVHGNKTLASRLLGLDRRTLFRKLEGYRLPTSAGGERAELNTSEESAQ